VPPSERRTHRQRQVPRITINRPRVEPVAGVVVLVEQVIGIEADTRIVSQLVLGHGIPDRIPRPVDVGSTCANTIARLPSRAGYRANVALRGHPCAKCQAVQRARQPIRGRSLEQVRRVAAAITVDTAEVQVRVARVNVPVRGQCTGDFQVDAVGFLARAGFVGVVTGRCGQVAVQHGLVFLLGAEVRRRGIQAAIEPFALDAGFVALPANRLDLAAAAGLGGLRGEDVGVAGV